MNRIFISYRSSDGKKDAARLAADLNERFGDQLVFYDKQDLVGGSSWRDAINATLGSKPAVLTLVTPDLVGAPHPEGGRRIDHEDDPIRGELLAARNSGAVILPLLVDGTVMPGRHELPAPLQFFAEAHARPLRTDDWNADLQRIVDDLQAHRIVPGDAATPDSQPLVQRTAQAMGQRVQRWLMYVGGVMVALVGIGLLLPEDKSSTGREETPPLSAAAPAPASPAAPTAPVAAPPAAVDETVPVDAAGVWWSVDEAGRRTRVRITLYGTNAALQTDPIPVAWYPEWQAYAQRLSAQGMVFDHIRYSGTGQWANGRLDLRFDVYSSAGHGPLDTGTLSLALSGDGRSLVGQLWSNGDQSNAPLRLVRQP